MECVQVYFGCVVCVINGLEYGVVVVCWIFVGCVYVQFGCVGVDCGDVVVFVGGFW